MDNINRVLRRWDLECGLKTYITRGRISCKETGMDTETRLNGDWSGEQPQHGLHSVKRDKATRAPLLDQPRKGGALQSGAHGILDANSQGQSSLATMSLGLNTETI